MARYWLLTKNKVITLILCFFITVAASGMFASGVTIALFPRIEDREKVTIPGTFVNLAYCRSRDGRFHCGGPLEFRKAKSSLEETKSLIDRLMARTIQTGASGATVALVILVAFLETPKQWRVARRPAFHFPHWLTYLTVSTGIAYCLAASILANLNAGSRKRLSLSTNLGARGERGTQRESEGGSDYGGIHVHRTAVVHIDNPQEFSMGSFKTDGLPDDSRAVEIVATVNDSALYSSKKKQDLFVA
ncbi:hypothetical protein B0H13DRAFT_2308994 [Mycena leptocephala]|nr:hypothetical protein B0H13DRAFT_2308994 [Mycena leptocephala]